MMADCLLRNPIGLFTGGGPGPEPESGHGKGSAAEGWGEQVQAVRIAGFALGIKCNIGD